jgi:hypothetical protein
LVLVAALSFQVAGLARRQAALVEIISEQSNVIAGIQENLGSTFYLLQSTMRDVDAIGSQVAVWQEMESYPPGWTLK